MVNNKSFILETNLFCSYSQNFPRCIILLFKILVFLITSDVLADNENLLQPPKGLVALHPTADLFDAACSTKVCVAVGGKGIVYTRESDGNWKIRHSGTFDDLKNVAITLDGTRWVAVGDKGTIVTSINGIIREVVVRDTPRQFNSVVFAITPEGNRWVAVGSFGRIVTSEDGINWVTKPKGTDEDLESIAVNPDGTRWVAVGTRGTIVTSANGKDWIEKTTNSYGRFQNVAVSLNGKHWVAVGFGGAIFTSINGEDWVDKSTDSNVDFVSVAIT